MPKAALSAYTATVRYRFENKRFNKRAEMTVRVTRRTGGVKAFEVLAESGSAFVRRQILRKIIAAEAKASADKEREQTRITLKNYDFRLMGHDSLDGRSTYVLEVLPKTRDRYLIRGRIWVDAEDFAIARIEGSPARNPSFWIRSVDIVRRYARNGQFWLPVLNDSRAEVTMCGTTEVLIEYFDYVLNNVRAPSSQDPFGGRGQ